MGEFKKIVQEKSIRKIILFEEHRNDHILQKASMIIIDKDRKVYDVRNLDELFPERGLVEQFEKMLNVLIEWNYKTCIH